jgi:hypothetical protein
LLARGALAGPAGQSSEELEAQATALIERVNQARQQAGLAPYAVNATLARAAQGHAEEIAEFSHYSHTGRDGRKAADRVRDAGYAAGREGLRVGENFVGRDSVDEGFGWLMSDPPHRANILDPDFREIGVGVGKVSYGYVWVMDLGTYAGIDEALAATDEPPASPSPEPSETPLSTALPDPHTAAPTGVATASVTVPVISTRAPETVTPEPRTQKPETPDATKPGRLGWLLGLLLVAAAGLGYAVYRANGRGD